MRGRKSPHFSLFKRMGKNTMVSDILFKQGVAKKYFGECERKIWEILWRARVFSFVLATLELEFTSNISHSFISLSPKLFFAIPCWNKASKNHSNFLHSLEFVCFFCACYSGAGVSPSIKLAKMSIFLKKLSSRP